MTVSKVTLTLMLLVLLGETNVCSASGSSVLHLQQDVSLGRVFRKMLTIRMLTGNIMRELCTPIMNCCHVNSKRPEENESESQR